MNRLSVAVLLLVSSLVSSIAHADSFDTLRELGQSNFLTFSENLAAATHYKAITPAEPLGLLGIDIGLAISATKLDKTLFDLASAGDYDISAIIVPRLQIHKGLPFGLDVGAFIAMAPGSDIKLMGAEIRYAILSGGIALPALGVRATISKLQGVDELSLDSKGLELTVSKGFLVFTPYAGIGIIRTNSTPNGVPEISSETFDQKKLYAGLNINLGLNFTLEADRTGDYTTFSLKGGFRF